MFVPLRSNISLRVRQWTWFRQNTSGTFRIGMKNHRPCKYKYTCKNPATGLCPGALPALRSTTICVCICMVTGPPYIINRPSKSTTSPPPNLTHTHQMFRLTKSRPPCQTARWGKKVELTWYPSCVPISKSDPGLKDWSLRWWRGHTKMRSEVVSKIHEMLELGFNISNGHESFIGAIIIVIVIIKQASMLSCNMFYLGMPPNSLR